MQYASIDSRPLRIGDPFAFAELTALAPTATTYDDGALTSGTIYAYRLQSYNGSTNSAFSIPAYAMALLPGDANADYSIDFNDVLAILGSGKYNTPAPAAWPDGDFNADGVVDDADLALLTSSTHYNAGPYWVPPPAPAAVAAPAAASPLPPTAPVSAPVITQRPRRHRDARPIVFSIAELRRQTDALA